MWEGILQRNLLLPFQQLLSSSVSIEFECILTFCAPPLLRLLLLFWYISQFDTLCFPKDFYLFFFNLLALPLFSVSLQFTFFLGYAYLACVTS